MRKILFLSFIAGFVACNPKGPKDQDKPNPDAPKSISYSIINTYPHDTSSFTEGLLIYKGDMYESTGEKGRSKLLKVDLKTGKPLKSFNLDEKYFGEGIVIINDTIYQLTYQEKVGFMYSLKDFKKLGEFKFASPEGWGMTTDGKQIIASDGTSTLYFYEPGTFRLLKTQAVTEAGSFAFNVNELEYIDGYIYANQWQAPYIFKIDPATGQVVGKADLSEIANRVKTNYPFTEYLNGIAYDAATKKIYITGKLWPELYEVQFSQ
jgi:glutamine cyclotransferase